MIYSETFKIGLKDIGKNNKIKNRAILEFLEDIGGYHSDTAGYGVNQIEETQLSWILLDWKLEVKNRPKYGDKLEIHTWARGINKLFTYRDYEIYNQKGEKCAIATSKWVLMNISKGKLERITDNIMEEYHPEEQQVFTEGLDKIKIPTEYNSKIEYKVKRKDIDLNKHMHNLYYLDLAYETLPEDVYEQRPFNKVQIVYKKEIKLGEKIYCYYTKEKNKNVITIKSEDNNTIHAVIELEQ